MKKKIFVVTHKNIELPNIEIYTPIVVGNKKFKFPDFYYRDDINDNISEKNPNYCELTALYWIWKNINNYDIVGLCHYRRYFVSQIQHGWEVLLKDETIEKYLNKYDIILPQKRVFLKQTVEEQYYSNDKAFKKDYEILRNVIKDKEPDYIEIFEEVSKSHSTFLYNMLITKKTTLNQYCEWLFNILFEVEKRVDISNYTAQQKRIFGYLSERLMTVYIIKNRLKVKEVNVINIEDDLKKERKKMIKNKIKRLILN